MDPHSLVAFSINLGWLSGGFSFGFNQGAGSIPQPAQTGLPFMNSDITVSIGSVISEMILYVGILSVMMITYGAIRLTLSEGEDAKAKKAKHIIIYSGIAVVASMGAYALVDIVNNFQLVSH